jgi:hypothetical protein
MARQSAGHAAGKPPPPLLRPIGSVGWRSKRARKQMQGARVIDKLEPLDSAFGIADVLTVRSAAGVGRPDFPEAIRQRRRKRGKAQRQARRRNR